MCKFHKEENQCTNFTREKSPCNKFHEQKWAQRAPRKNPCTTSSMNKISFMWRKKFHEEKNQDATSFTNKNPQAISFTNKNQHATSFHEQNLFYEQKNQCTSFTKRKINIQQVSRTKIITHQVQLPQTCHATISMSKISVQVSRREKSTCNKTKRKIKMQEVSWTKSARNMFHKQKSAWNKFHDRNQFHI